MLEPQCPRAAASAARAGACHACPAFSLHPERSRAAAYWLNSLHHKILGHRILQRDLSRWRDFRTRGPVPAPRRPAHRAGACKSRPSTPILPGRSSRGATNPDPEVPIDGLSSKQRAHLRALAHHLKPVLQVGADGVTEAVADAVRDALNTRELLKVKVLESSPLDARAAAEELTGRIDGAHVPQVIGRTVVLYRRHPESPEIRLPD